jgi:hypothetical protein
MESYLAMYGCAFHVAPEAYLELLEEVLRPTGPRTFSYLYSTPQSEQSGRVVPATRERLVTYIRRGGAVTSLGIGAALSRSATADAAIADVEFAPDVAMATVSWQNDTVDVDRDAMFLHASKTLTRGLTPSYGIGFVRAIELCPFLYVSGFPFGLSGEGDELPEEEAIRAWGEFIHGPEEPKRRLLCTGMRDVYPFNLIGNGHLDRRVTPRETLREAIATRPGWGRLTPVAANVWAWGLAEGEIPVVRGALMAAGFLIAPTIPVRAGGRSRETRARRKSGTTRGRGRRSRSLT